MSRDLFAGLAIAQIPKILTLLDRNPHSPTYGCFDRNFWHYKIIDFPSGMAQEFVWPLALAYDTNVPNNPFYRQSAIREWVEAGILYAAKSAHKDGSCDDYFPYERAGGAAAFSLLACVESYTLLRLNNPDILTFFEKRSDWLAHHHESGRLSNHQALIVLCLELVSRLLSTTKWNAAKEQRLETVLSWQNPEGWFQEYEGCDPGYHTLTISCLARIYELTPTTRLKDAIGKAVGLAAHFIHPDGSFGGEYTSRNTYNFFPHGFELVGKWMPKALHINDLFLVGIANGKSPCYSDDHIIGHHTWNYLLAWRDFVVDRPLLPPRPTGRLWLPEAQILIDRRQDTELYLALNKGGVFKLFRGHQLIASDTQFSLQVREGKTIKNAVAHLIGYYRVHLAEDEISIQGQLGWAKQKQMTTINLLFLRVVMLSFGRFFPNLIRRFLQKMLITGKKKAPFHFHRQLRWENDRWCVIDQLQAESWENVVSAGIGCDQTSIYVVMSRTFQIGQLQPWLDLTEKIKQMAPGKKLKLERNF
ncbi:MULTISPECIES: hypothetical protein [Aerosakkonema]|uniref:hypothetical protein n=1 Tax=Aerosakkonema TaxID=1246629 RepID=UPI0035B867C4